MLKLKKGDQVKVVAGKDKGKIGEIMQVFPKKFTAIVKGANMYKKAVKATQNREGGLISAERPLSFAKIALMDGASYVRVGFKVTKDSKTRINIKTGKSL